MFETHHLASDPIHKYRTIDECRRYFSFSCFFSLTKTIEDDLVTISQPRMADYSIVLLGSESEHPQCKITFYVCALLIFFHFCLKLGQEGSSFIAVFLAFIVNFKVQPLEIITSLET
uniref:AlNc14C69G4790 protein n=1 Tax=Albugo laibachii Nc14 TaxID=890382 RepID=F0WDS1_9STRA|nr:AlNc14C69G4790 [Albugo laibachii Nc14]|eukprot:CCA19348.1 AlNc14C69G4790 [Albugo laibachii Nc14]